MAKEKGKKKKGGCLTAIIVIILVIVIIVLAVVAGPLVSVIKFAEAFMALFEGETPEEELYEWVLVNGPELDISLGAIENSPYDVEAVKAALKCEVAYIDNNLYVYEVHNENNETYKVQYNMQALTSNYGTPWQLLLAVCTTSYYSSMTDFIAATDEELSYAVTAEDVENTHKYLGSKISYITDYSEYWLRECPTYEEMRDNCVTDLDDVDGKFTCVYRTDSDGYGVYYPVVCLDTVSTWLYDYEFSYDLTLDEEGRPIEYSLSGVTKTSNVERFIESLEKCGVNESEIPTLKFILGLMPYASNRGLTTVLDTEYNNYVVMEEESVVTDVDYKEYLALKEMKGDIYSAAAMDKIRSEWMADGYHNDWVNPVNGIDMNCMRYRSDVAIYASKFVHAIYEMPAIYREGFEVGKITKVSHLSQWYRLSTKMTDSYPDLGEVLVEQSGTDEEAYENDQELIAKLEAVGGYSYGMVHGMSDWDFVVMVLADTLYFDVSNSYIYNTGLLYRDSRDWFWGGARYCYPALDEDYISFVKNNNDSNKPLDYEHKYLTTSDAFYDLVVNLNKLGDKNGVYVIDADSSYHSNESALEELKIGDLGFEVIGDDAVNVGIYIGKVNGYDAFIHLGGGSTDLTNAQSSVEISYLESSGAIHPDGGTVNYNTFIRINIGSYPMLEDGKFGGSFIRFKE